MNKEEERRCSDMHACERDESDDSFEKSLEDCDDSFSCISNTSYSLPSSDLFSTTI